MSRWKQNRNTIRTLAIRRVSVCHYKLVNIYRNDRETSKLAYIIDHCTVNMIFEGFPAVVTLPFVNSTNYSTWESTIEQVIVDFSFVLEWIMHLLQFLIKLVNEVCSENTFCLG